MGEEYNRYNRIIFPIFFVLQLKLDYGHITNFLGYTLFQIVMIIYLCYSGIKYYQFSKYFNVNASDIMPKYNFWVRIFIINLVVYTFTCCFSYSISLVILATQIISFSALERLYILSIITNNSDKIKSAIVHMWKEYRKNIFAVILVITVSLFSSGNYLQAIKYGDNYILVVLSLLMFVYFTILIKSQN